MFPSNSLLTIAFLLSISCNQSVFAQTASSPDTGSTASSPPTAASPATTGTSSSSSGSTSSSPGGGSGGAAGLTAGLSSTCQTAAGSLLTSDFGTCSNIIGLVSVLGASGSIISPLNNWITGVCSAAPCSTDTLSSANQTITSGCGPDVQKGSAAAGALITVISNYNAVKNLLCTQYTSNSTFCVPSILGNVQTALGQNVTVTEVASILSGGTSSASQTAANIPPSAYCNDCGHALVTQSAAFVTSTNIGPVAAGASTNSTSSMKAVAGVCGASFSDGKLPSTVRIATKDSSKKNSAGARERGSLFNAALLALASTIFFQLV